MAMGAPAAVWLSVAVALGLFALTVAQVGRKNPLNANLVALPDSNLDDVQSMKESKDLTGTLGLLDFRLLLFGVVPEEDGTFPSVLLSLYVLNPHGDVDLFCLPFFWLQTFRILPSPRTNFWRSIHSQKEDSIYLSSSSTHFNSSMMTIDDGSDTNTTMTVAAFACTLLGESITPSEYRLETDLVDGNLELVEEEREVMEAIYSKCCLDEESCLQWKTPQFGTDSEKTVEKDGKSVEMDFCHRKGSFCTSDGRLKVLSLRLYGLDCEVPVDEFKKLKFVEKLELDGNLFKGDAGKVLDALSEMKNLHWLSLAANMLTGSLSSSQRACRMFDEKLSFLNLGWNDIGGKLPECILSSTSLLELHVHGNKIFGAIPDTVQEDAKLEALGLAHNLFRGNVPESLGNARFLRYVSFVNNSLSGDIPEVLGALPLLERVALSLNNFEHLPKAWVDPEWDPPPYLTDVNISFNRIEDTFPVGFGRAPNLLALDISNNKFSGSLDIREDFFPKLVRFNASNNEFSGPIPTAVSGMNLFKPSRLELALSRLFDVSNNQLSGEIPEGLYTSSSQWVRFSLVRLGQNNMFTCKEPDELDYIPDLDCKAPEQVDLLENTDMIDVAGGGSDRGSKKSSLKSTLVGVVVAAVVALVVISAVAIVIVRRKKARSMEHIKFPEQGTGDGDVEFGTIKVHDADSILPQQVPRS